MAVDLLCDVGYKVCQSQFRPALTIYNNVFRYNRGVSVVVTAIALSQWLDG